MSSLSGRRSRAAEPMDFETVKEMGFSHAELSRLLPRVLARLGGVPRVLDSPPRFLMAEGGRSVEIRLESEDRRALGRLSVPVTQVRFCFAGYGADGADRLLEAIMRGLQRGGG